MTRPAAEKAASFDWPLMADNVSGEDLDTLIRFLKTKPRLTQSEQVRQFEEEWSAWAGVRYSVLLNSGSSANLITLAALRERFGTGEIIVPTLTWVSDIAAVLHCGFTPVFVDIHPQTLGMDPVEVMAKANAKTKAVFLTHILGYNALSDRLLDFLRDKKIPLIEDACESHGATFRGRKVGSFGFASNFSFYYAHHLSTIEGGMVCTNDEEFYQMVRMFRAHGLVRESTSRDLRDQYEKDNPDLTPEFIFAFPAYNMRSTEMQAVIGRNQLKRLDTAIVRRNANLLTFLKNLDTAKYQTDFAVEGCSNYAFTLILREKFKDRMGKVLGELTRAGVEYRRGTSGGGNQLRQPYLRKLYGDVYQNFPNVEHVHFYGCYIGNHAGLETDKIKWLCKLLNSIT